MSYVAAARSISPEGHYSYDGRLRPMRGAVHRLAPLATIYLIVSATIHSFRGVSRCFTAWSASTVRRCSLRWQHSAVVTSQLLGAWLHIATKLHAGRSLRCSRRTHCESAATDFRRSGAAAPRSAQVRAALPLMVNWKILQRDGDRYRTTAERRHPQFPFVRVFSPIKAAFLEETLEMRTMRMS